MFVVGTAHVSSKSAEDVKRVVEVSSGTTSVLDR